MTGPLECFEHHHLPFNRAGECQPAHYWDFADFEVERESGRTTVDPFTIYNGAHAVAHDDFRSIADSKYCKFSTRRKRDIICRPQYFRLWHISFKVAGKQTRSLMHRIAQGFRRTEQKEQNMLVHHCYFRQCTDPFFSIEFCGVSQSCREERQIPVFEHFINRERQRKQNMRSQ